VTKEGLWTRNDGPRWAGGRKKRAGGGVKKVWGNNKRGGKKEKKTGLIKENSEGADRGERAQAGEENEHNNKYGGRRSKKRVGWEKNENQKDSFSRGLGHGPCVKEGKVGRADVGEKKK